MSLRDFYVGKKVLITGHTGFKGSWLSQWLIQMGANVTGLAIGPDAVSHYNALGLANNMKSFYGDIVWPEFVGQVFKEVNPEIVFHLAAQSLVGESYRDPLHTFTTNVVGTANVIEQIRDSDTVRSAIIVTSDKCYENNGKSIAYTESDPMGGKDPYSASKGAAEIVFHSYARSFDMKHIGSARAGNVIGGHDWAKNRIVPDCVKAWNKKETAVIRNPDYVRPWQHVLEPLSGYLVQAQALYESRQDVGAESFNFGPGPNGHKSVRDLVKELGKYYFQNEIRTGDTEDNKESAMLTLETIKAEKRLSWTPTLLFEEAVLMTAEGYRANNVISSQQIDTYMMLAKARGLKWAN